MAVMGERGASHLRRQRDRLVNEHDRDIVPYRVKKLLILAQQAAFEAFFNELPRAIAQCALGDLLIDLSYERCVRHGQRLVGLRATKDFQQGR